jgi:hypothetical protein
MAVTRVAAQALQQRLQRLGRRGRRREAVVLRRHGVQVADALRRDAQHQPQRCSPRPTSTVTTRWPAASGSTATVRAVPGGCAPPSGVRFRNHSVAGIAATTTTSHSSEDTS